MLDTRRPLFALYGTDGELVRCFTCWRMLTFYWPDPEREIVPVGSCNHGRTDAAAAYHAVVHLFSETIRATAAKGGKR